jgi:hypothetical protein
MSAGYVVDLARDPNVLMHVRFTTLRRDVVDYAVLLTVDHEGRMETVRLYDGAHGINEMHRYTRKGGKQLAEVFHNGTLGEGMRSAVEHVKRSYGPMIEAWQAR